MSYDMKRKKKVTERTKYIHQIGRNW